MPCTPGSVPVSSDVSAAAVVDGKTVRAVSFLDPAAARKRPCPARAARLRAPRPSTTNSTALVAGANHSDRPSRAAISSGTTRVRLRVLDGSTGRLRDIRASLAHLREAPAG